MRERIQLLIFGLAGCWLILSSLYDHCWILATSKKLKYVDFSSWSKFIWLNVGQLKICFVTSGVTIDSPSTPESQLRVRVEPSFDSPINSESEPAKNWWVRVESEPSLDSDPSLTVIVVGTYICCSLNRLLFWGSKNTKKTKITSSQHAWEFSFKYMHNSYILFGLHHSFVRPFRNLKCISVSYSNYDCKTWNQSPPLLLLLWTS